MYVCLLCIKFILLLDNIYEIETQNINIIVF